ncbi:tripartite ATP-independent transporter DctM subunit [Bradyrhizobium sp. AZCC 1588]|uniref:TRAP transporter large permease n=1 Tax=unclassified Bradyrhizobium TaxID=2631580 RepID=UPI002FEFB216
MTPETLIGLVMLLVLLGAIFIGIPISFTLLFLALSFGWLGLGETVFNLAYFQTIGLMKEEVLAAVPLFILMGFVTQEAGLMERLFIAFRHLMAPVRGSLYVVVVITAAVFAMATGIVGAAVTVLGIMASPIMTRSGYSAQLSAGAIAAGGTLGILIPPSVMLIVMGPVLGVSVADLYAAAIVPGFMLASIYLVYLLARSMIDPGLGPAMPMEERVRSLPAILGEVAVGVVPLLALITATLGSILAGLATPTEAAGVGAAGSLVLAAGYRKLTWTAFRKALIATMVTSSMVLLLAGTSNIFGAVFARLGTANWITEGLLALELSKTSMLILVLTLVFVLGWPFEWPAVILVFLPIFYPVVAALQIDLVWFGALVAVVLQTAFLSPPIAMSAYYLKQVVDKWSLLDIYKGMFQFMFLQLLAVGLLISFPQIATWLPERLAAASRAEKIPEQYQRIIQQQRRQAPSLEMDPLMQQ